MTAAPPDALAVLRRPAVRRWVGARLAAGVAMSALRATVLWQVYDHTRDTALLGLTGLLAFAPAPFAALLGGVIADAHSRKRVVLTAQAVEWLTAGTLALGSLLGALPLWALYALFVANAAATAFEAPARQATLPNLVPKEELARAVTVMGTAQSFAFVSGPAIAGFSIAEGGPALAYGICFALLSLAMPLVSSLDEPPIGARKGAVGLAAVREGLAFVRRQPVVLGALSIDLFAVIFGGATAMLPVYANDILGVGARGYGLLAASLDIGAVVTSIALVFLPPIRRLGRAVFLAVIAYGAATIVFGLSRSLPLSIAAYVVVGLADQVSVVGRITLVQLSTPDELRGRVSAVNMIFIIASNQLSVAESGFVARLTSPTFSVVSGGVMVFFVAVLIAVFVPALWRYEQPREA